MKQPTHGGARKGAGRKPGVCKAPPTFTSSLRMRTSTWAKLDELRGSKSRSAFVAEMIEGEHFFRKSGLTERSKQ
jgi:hypothetical protein